MKILTGYKIKVFSNNDWKKSSSSKGLMHVQQKYTDIR